MSVLPPLELFEADLPELAFLPQEVADVFEFLGMVVEMMVKVFDEESAS